MADIAQHPADRRAAPRLFAVHTWTFTSHILFTLGRLPWIDRRSDTSQQKTELADLLLWQTRLGLPDDHPFKQERDLRTGLHRLGYQLNAITSANPLTEDSRFRPFVDNLVSVGQFENCLERVLPHIDMSRKQVLIINVCETHYPYYDWRLRSGGQGSRRSSCMASPRRCTPRRRARR